VSQECQRHRADCKTYKFWGHKDVALISRVSDTYYMATMHKDMPFNCNFSWEAAILQGRESYGSSYSDASSLPPYYSPCPSPGETFIERTPNGRFAKCFDDIMITLDNQEDGCHVPFYGCSAYISGSVHLKKQFGAISRLSLQVRVLISRRYLLM
jgi:hypothetical protein